MGMRNLATLDKVYLSYNLLSFSSDLLSISNFTLQKVSTTLATYTYPHWNSQAGSARRLRTSVRPQGLGRNPWGGLHSCPSNPPPYGLKWAWYSAAAKILPHDKRSSGRHNLQPLAQRIFSFFASVIRHARNALIWCGPLFYQSLPHATGKN